MTAKKNKNKTNETSRARLTRRSPENRQGFLDGYEYAIKCLRKDLTDTESIADVRYRLDIIGETVKILRQLVTKAQEREEENHD